MTGIVVIALAHGILLAPILLAHCSFIYERTASNPVIKITDEKKIEIDCTKNVAPINNRDGESKDAVTTTAAPQIISLDSNARFKKAGGI